MCEIVSFGHFTVSNRVIQTFYATPYHTTRVLNSIVFRVRTSGRHLQSTCCVRKTHSKQRRDYRERGNYRDGSILKPFIFFIQRLQW